MQKHDHDPSGSFTLGLSQYPVSGSTVTIGEALLMCVSYEFSSDDAHLK